MWDELKSQLFLLKKTATAGVFTLCRRQVKIKTDDAKMKNKIYKAAPYSSKIQTLFQWLIATKYPYGYSIIYIKKEPDQQHFRVAIYVYI
jgi:phosphopantetheine adenylyltransferase